MPDPIVWPELRLNMKPCRKSVKACRQLKRLCAAAEVPERRRSEPDRPAKNFHLRDPVFGEP